MHSTLGPGRPTSELAGPDCSSSFVGSVLAQTPLRLCLQCCGWFARTEEQNVVRLVGPTAEFCQILSNFIDFWQFVD